MYRRRVEDDEFISVSCILLLLLLVSVDVLTFCNVAHIIEFSFIFCFFLYS
jgi:hypothetical protein